MGVAARLSSSWASMKLDKSVVCSRRPTAREVVFTLLLLFLAYLLLWLPIFHLVEALAGRSTHHHGPIIVEPGEDTIKHFAGSRDCGITQSDIYLAPQPTNPKVSPFCKNRATLLEALSGGGRHGWGEPFVGKGCTYRWFSTPEICMILERFNAISFVGDQVVQSVYTAFNVLLREDFALGGLEQWKMSDQSRMNCKCDGQSLSPECTGNAVMNTDEATKNGGGDRKGSPYFCSRIPHAYIPVYSLPTSATSQTLFKGLTYSRPNPWQPSPLIFSYSDSSLFEVAPTTRAMEEWYALAAAAKRNIPMLFLGPTAFSISKAPGTGPKEGSAAVWQYQEQVSGIAKENHFEVLSLFNLTMQASTPDGWRFGEKVALVEAMMVINWLSMLGTS